MVKNVVADQRNWFNSENTLIIHWFHRRHYREQQSRQSSCACIRRRWALLEQLVCRCHCDIVILDRPTWQWLQFQTGGHTNNHLQWATGLVPDLLSAVFVSTTQIPSTIWSAPDLAFEISNRHTKVDYWHFRPGYFLNRTFLSSLDIFGRLCHSRTTYWWTEGEHFSFD